MREAYLNDGEYPYVSRDKTYPVTITVDDDQQNDWLIAKVVIGYKAVDEILLARTVENTSKTEYVLVILNRVKGLVSSKPVPYIATIERSPWSDRPDFDNWLDDWDEALVSLKEEAILLQMTR